ncbi:hypothetical protein [Lysobacter sp. D1-1-M9]|uniref:hypothetical protein n=1 Tax=Novilysobacter longmucuonensis TaxID=3098603 RepID=UPI002FC9DC8D
MASTAPSRLPSDPRLVATRLDLARVTRRGVATVLVATLLQWAWPWRSNLLVALGMGACYALAAAGVWRENRRVPGC